MNRISNESRRLIVQPSAALAAAKAARGGKNKVLRRASRPRPMRLENRDLEVLRALAEHRFLSSEQLHRLIFTCGASMVRRRLRALYDHKLIERIAVLSQPTRGIPPYVYILDSDGAAVLSDLGEPTQAGRFDNQRLLHVRHKYLVNDFAVTVAQASRNKPYSLVDWQHEHKLLLPTKTDKTRAEQVKHPLLPKPMPFMPDGYFQLELGANDERLSFFVEVDLASHPLRKWRQRARLYAAYADPGAGLFRRRFGRENFRLLIITTPDYRGRSRSNNILTTIQRELNEAKMPQESRLFLGTTLPEVTPEAIFGNIWRQPDQNKADAFFSFLAVHTRT